MIFVTVGTHEQPFDRLIRKMDEIKGQNLIPDDVFIQVGYSKHVPQYCNFERFLGYEEIDKRVCEARIVITHGGPGSIMLPFKYHKVPIVVPRQRQFDEHVDDHQVLFAKRMQRYNRILAILDVDELLICILNYESLILNITRGVESTNTQVFTKRLEEIASELIKGK